jgi:kinetochore protein NDC80
LDRKREEYCRDLEKFSDLINKLKEHKSSSEDKVQDKRSELQALEEELAGINTKLEDIRAIVASQGITVEDAKRLHSEKAHVMDAISKGSTAKHECNKVLWDLEMELSRECHELESLTFQYNNTAANLVDSSGYGKKFIADTEVKITATSDPRMLLGGVDISGEVLPYALALKQSIMQQISDRKQQLMRLLDQEQVLEVSRTEVLDNATVR